MNKELIEIRLIQLNIKKKDLADMLGISYKQLYNIINNINEPSFRLGLKLAEILKVNPYDLI